MKCSICKTEITADPNGWKGGCNAKPVNNGICCYKCDINVVLPARLTQHGFDNKEIEAIIQTSLHNEKNKETKKWDSTYMG